MVFSSGVGRRDELHTYGFGLLREIVKDPLAIPLLEVVLPPVGVFLPVGEHGVDQSGQLVGACPCAPQPSDRSRWSIGRLRSYPVKDGLRCGEWIQPSKLCVSNQPQATFDFSSSAVQRLLSIDHGVATVCFSTRSCLLRAACPAVELFRSRREAKVFSARRCASGQEHRQGAVDLDLDASVADGQHSQRSVRTG